MRRIVAVVALATSMLVAWSPVAIAAGSKPLLVSRGDPFAACAVGGDGSGVNYRSAEVEPWIADNPANTRNLVASWQQDRWSDGGARGQVAAWTFNGGRSWASTPQPFTLCAQPYYRTPVLRYERASDPWQSFGPDGTAYAVSLVFDGDSIRNGLGVAVSHDGGRTWVGQQDIDPLLARADTFDPGDDKESVTADPLRPGTAYVVWDQLRDIFGPCTTPSRAPITRAHDRPAKARRSATLAGADCPVGFTGPALISRTTDGGRTWEKPRVFVETGLNEQTIGNVVVINRQTDVLYDFFNYIDASGADNVEMVSSLDHGVTWGPRQYVARLATTAETRPLPGGCGCGVTYPGDPSKALRTGDIIPEPAIDPNTGQLYAIWQDGSRNGFQNDVLLASTSTGEGVTGSWSPPVEVNPPASKSAFTPGIAVDSRGRVGVTYYDLTPPLTDPSVLLTDTWFTQTAGPGLTFGSRTRVGRAFNMEAAPQARGWFVGDYQGLAALLARPSSEEASDQEQGATGFGAIFVRTRCTDSSCANQGTMDGHPAGSDPTDVYSARLGGGGGD